MGEVIGLHGRSVPPAEDDELVADLARFADGSLSMAAVKARHRLTDAEWAALGEDDALVRACEAEKTRRIRSGQTKRELAQNEIVAAPPILAGIMKNPDSNARHVVDAIKTLDSLASNGAEAAAAATRFVIQINMGSDTLTFNKAIRPLEPGETDPDDSGPDTADVIAAIAMDKATRDDGGGQGHI